MKGYFSKIANRTVGSASKATFAPPKAHPWQKQEAQGDQPLKSDQADMAEWPDSFDGNPVHPTANPSPSKLNPSQVSEHSLHREQISSPLQPPTAQVQPPTTLEPVQQEVQEVHVVPSPRNLSPQKPSDLPTIEESRTEGKEQVQSMEPVKVPPPAAGKDKEAPKSETPMLKDSPVIEPVPPQQPSKPIQPRGYARTPMVINETEGLMGSVLPELPPKPGALAPLKVEQQVPATPLAPAKTEEPKLEKTVALQPAVLQAQKPSLPPETRNLQPHTPAPKAPIPNQGPHQGNKGGLVIGKITVEVVDAPKPQVQVQAPTQQSARGHSQRQPLRRPDSNLKYGLGQI